MPGIVFFGSPEFAIPSLEALVRAGERISAVVTQPDRPAGRGRRPRPPAVKAWAEEHGLEVVQPEKVKSMEFLDTMRRLAPELAVVVAFGQILPKSLLAIPDMGFINVHASLLPKYRGAAPIQWAVMNGERVTGVTIQKVVKELDAGDILSQERIQIGPNETAGELHDRLAALGARMLAPTIAAMRAGEVVPVPQDHEKATYARMLEKSDGEVDWSLPSIRIHDLVRGLNPWPSAYTYLGRKRLIVHRTEVLDTNAEEAPPGTILEAGPKRLAVSAGSGALSLLEVQLEGKRRSNWRSFLAGARLAPGDKLGR